MSKKRKRFLMYNDWSNLVSWLSPDACKELLNAIFEWQEWWDPVLTTEAKLVWLFIMQQFEKDAEEYEKKCKASKDAAESRWKEKDTNASQRMQSNADACERMQTNADNDIDIDSDIDNDIDIVNDSDKEKDIYKITTTNVVEAKPEYWNKEINALIDKIKQVVEENSMTYKAGKYERWRARNILGAKQFWSLASKYWKTPANFAIDVLRESFQHKFWSWKVYNCDTIYKHYATIYNDHIAKRKKEEVKVYSF